MKTVTHSGDVFFSERNVERYTAAKGRIFEP